MAQNNNRKKLAEKFDRINRNNLKLKDRSKRTRTGAYKTPNRVSR